MAAEQLQDIITGSVMPSEKMDSSSSCQRDQPLAPGYRISCTIRMGSFQSFHCLAMTAAVPTDYHSIALRYGFSELE